MKAVLLAMVVSAAAIPAHAASLISLGSFNNPYTEDFSGVPAGPIDGTPPILDPAFTALGFTDVTATGSDPNTNPFAGSVRGLAATVSNDLIIIEPTSPAALVSLTISLAQSMQRFAFTIDTSTFTDTFTVQFLGTFGSETFDFDTDQGGNDGGVYDIALQADNPFSTVNFTGLDKAVFGSFTVETPSQIPLPAGLPLLLAGLGGLGVLRLRRKG